jgi:hypothetical protein
MSTSGKKSKVSTNIPAQEATKLWVSAGGRCEFPGCNKYLLRDDLTRKEALLGENAHIAARSLIGPRGDSNLPLNERNKADNLMLLCLDHHNLIDISSKDYPEVKLRQYKSDHEARIHHQTSIAADHQTLVIKMEASIAGEVVRLLDGQMYEAMEPKYPLPYENSNGVLIDLTSLPPPDDKSYYKMGKKIIDKILDPIFDPGVGKQKISHCSLFALGPIPLLLYLGNKLSNKVSTDLYQKHRDTQDWKWKTAGEAIEYSFAELKKGDVDKVALALSMSGKIAIEKLPSEVIENYSIYEITIKDPNPTVLNTREQLDQFCKFYLQTIGKIQERHTNIEEVSLFPAIPAPIAISCGKELLKKVHPSLIVYDYNKNLGGFSKVMKVG